MVPETTLTQLMAEHLQKRNVNLVVLITNEIRSQWSPFSGGGDIVVFHEHKSAVVTTTLDANSPTDVNEVKTCFNFELKLAERGGEALV